ncbi:MAG TPA: PA2169 family four-helix-bundle protein [Candidatus Eisenbacteria bacterium]|nr:PA2169 family four-helix-bundle protein [Candidatus Eisenbacteria bacterium]
MEQSALISTLSGLLDALEDGHAGYQIAAQGIKDSRMKRALGQIALERKRLGEELRGAILEHGAAPRSHGTVAGALHRGWIQVKELGHAAPAAILEECGRGEAASIKLFKEALAKDLPPGARKVVALHLDRISAARERVLELRRSTVDLPDAPKS